MANRSELREKIMTIIYQISLYKNNKIIEYLLKKLYNYYKIKYFK